MHLHYSYRLLNNSKLYRLYIYTCICIIRIGCYMIQNCIGFFKSYLCIFFRIFLQRCENSHMCQEKICDLVLLRSALFAIKTSYVKADVKVFPEDFINGFAWLPHPTLAPAGFSPGRGYNWCLHYFLPNFRFPEEREEGAWPKNKPTFQFFLFHQARGANAHSPHLPECADTHVLWDNIGEPDHPYLLHPLLLQIFFYANR